MITRCSLCKVTFIPNSVGRPALYCSDYCRKRTHQLRVRYTNLTLEALAIRHELGALHISAPIFPGGR